MLYIQSGGVLVCYIQYSRNNVITTTKKKKKIKPKILWHTERYIFVFRRYTLEAHG